MGIWVFGARYIGGRGETKDRTRGSGYGSGRREQEVAVNEAIARQAQRRILVFDHTKFGQVANCVVCPIRDVDTIITDGGASDELTDLFVALGIEVVRG